MNGEPEPEWKWTETPYFARCFQHIYPDYDPDASEEQSDPDLVHWAIHENILADPVGGSNPLFPLGDPAYDARLRYFRTYDVPGLGDEPPMIVVFRIERLPDEGQVGEVTGELILTEADAQMGYFLDP